MGGMAEMGLGLIFPLVLILNLQMDPALAGIALIPATVPMVIVAPLTGRWCDRTGGGPPLVAGFAFLALSGVLLAIGVGHNSYLWLLPGLLVYGIGLAIVLTVNDPVSLDTVPESDDGQVSGVSATAEQGGGAIGIALLYALFHSAYISRLYSEIESKNLPRLDEATSSAFRDQIQAAEQTGLRPGSFDPTLTQIPPAGRGGRLYGHVPRRHRVVPAGHGCGGLARPQATAGGSAGQHRSGAAAAASDIVGSPASTAAWPQCWPHSESSSSPPTSRWCV